MQDNPVTTKQELCQLLNLVETVLITEFGNAEPLSNSWVDQKMLIARTLSRMKDNL